MGYRSNASGKYSVAIGSRSVASGLQSTAGHRSAKATGDGAAAFGYESTASGKLSVTLAPFSEASGQCAVAAGADSKSIGDYSTTFGNGTIAGMKAYYYTAINPTTKKIYLSEISVLTAWDERNLQPVYGDTVTDENYLISGFTAPAWNVGDWLGVINNSHFVYKIQVVSVENNVVTYKGYLGFSKIPYVSGEWDDGLDSYTVFNLSQPTEGLFDITYGATALGKETKAIGIGALATGSKTSACGKNSHAGGLGTRATADNQTVVGQWNAKDNEALFIVGNGTADWSNGAFTNEQRHNAFSVMSSSTPTIKIGNTSLTEPQLKDLLTEDTVSWDEITDKPNVVVLDKTNIEVSYPYYDSDPLSEVSLSDSTVARLFDPEFCTKYPDISGIGEIGYFEAGDHDIYPSGGTFEKSDNYWVIKHSSAPVTDDIIAIGIFTPGTYSFGSSTQGTFTQPGLYMIACGGYWYSETLKLISVSGTLSEDLIPDIYVRKKGNAQIKGSLLGGDSSVKRYFKPTSSTIYDNSDIASITITYDENSVVEDSYYNSGDQYILISGENLDLKVGDYIENLRFTYSYQGYPQGETSLSGVYTELGVYFINERLGYIHEVVLVDGATFTVYKGSTKIPFNYFAYGYGLVINNSNMAVVGKYNQYDEVHNEDNLFVVGNGTNHYTGRSNAMVVKKNGEVALCSGGSLKIGNATLTEEKLNNLSTGGVSTSYNIKTVDTYIEIPSGTSLAYMRRLPPTAIVVDNERALLKFGPEYTDSEIGTIDDVVQKMNNTNEDYSVILNPLETTYTTVFEDTQGKTKTSHADRIIYTINSKNGAASLTLDTTTNKYVGTVTMYYLQEA